MVRAADFDREAARAAAKCGGYSQFSPESRFVFAAGLPTVAGMTSQRLLLAAGLLGFSGVALGAFGAHGLKATLEAGNHLENWKTAVFYQLVHAVALLVLAGRPTLSPKTGGLWLAGVVCFSGSLYWIALGGPVKVLWPVTPLGGLLLLAGWAGLIAAAFRKNDA